MLKQIILLLFVSILISCQTITEPVKNETKWENITYNLTGEKIINVKVHKSELYASNSYNIYLFHNKNWEEILTTGNIYISDFIFKNDSIFIVSNLGKIYYAHSKDSIVVKYDLKSTEKLKFPLTMINLQNSFYIGSSTSEGSLGYGLTKANNDKIYNYPMNNFNTSYTVSNIIQNNKTIYIGTTYTSGYFVGKLENGILTSIGMDGRYSIGSCYSMALAGDTLLVGSGGEVLYYLNNIWSLYKNMIPTIEGTVLKDKAISLLVHNGQVLVGTFHNSIIYYNGRKNSWETYFNKNLPAKLGINSLLQNDNYIYAVLGHFDFEDTKSQYLYRLDTSKLNRK